MPRLKITDAGPVITSDGSGVDFNSIGPISAVSTLTANTTIGAGGMYVLSAANGKLIITLPQAATVPLATFGFRAASPQNGHILTSSEGGSVLGVFCLPSGTYSPVTVGGIASGTFLTMSSNPGTSVIMISDGQKYSIFAGSGSFTFGTGT